MRIRTTIALVAALLMITCITGSSYSFDMQSLAVGVRGGLGPGMVNGNFPDQMEVGLDLSYGFGVSGEVSIMPGFTGFAGIYYKNIATTLQKSFTFSNVAEDTLKLRYIDLVLLGKLDLSEYLWIGTGPSVLFYMGKNTRYIELSTSLYETQITTIDFNDKPNLFVLAWNFGFGFNIALSETIAFHLDSMFEIGITEAVSYSDDKHHNLQNFGFMAGLSYKIFQ